jgi:putative SOS response-associated peptidase YedK
MCGRFDLHSPPRSIAGAFAASYDDALEQDWRPSWNIAPTADVLGVAIEQGERTLGRYRWGLIPSWAKDPSIGSRAFNARAETAASRPMFRAAFRARRCLIPADGYYEWSQAPGEKRQPYYFSCADNALLAFAGLYEFWRAPSESDRTSTRSCTILTTTAGRATVDVHEREPVVLAPELWDAWLDPDLTDRNELEAMLGSLESATLVRRRVGREVGRSSADGPGLIAPSD